jgi:predicted amidohydrolase YtcJ
VAGPTDDPIPDTTATEAAARAWVRCGAAALSGPPPGGLLGPPEGLVPGVLALGERIRTISASWGHELDLDWLGLLTARAAVEGLVAGGRTSCGGASRLLATADGWVALSLARDSDVELVPAWLALAGDPEPWRGPSDESVGSDGPDGVWPQVEARVRHLAGTALGEAAGVLGLPVGVLGERAADPDGGTVVRRFGPRGAVPAGPPLRVLDLSTLWAGPLCASLIGRCGSEVVKVTSRHRPDGAATGNPEWYGVLNGDKRHVELALDTAAGKAELAELIARADVVVESARPRALEQMGIVAAEVLAATDGPRVWISITGHGRSSPRVAFGDDAAVAGGLVVFDGDGPWFCADAVADPLSGLAAVDAALGCLAEGTRALVEVSMAGVAAAHAAHAAATRSVSRDRPLRDAVTAQKGGEGTTIVDAELDGRRVDVRIEDGRITRIDSSLPRSGTRVVRAGGGALLPGLHDHHLHLMAMAARDRSTDVAPARDASAFDKQLRDAHRSLGAGEWLRVVGYDEAHGPLDPVRLDALAPGRAVRVQHRTGAAWMVSSVGSALAGVGPGWCHREDERLGRSWEGDPPPDLASVGRRLAVYGVTGVTDATPSTDTAAFDTLAAARAAGALHQRVMVTGGHQLASHTPPAELEQGPVKIIVGDHELPDPDALAGWFLAAHRASRPVAVHCVTRVALVLALVAWEQAGSVPGDRVEHASVVPLELIGPLSALGVRVVTQPGFVHAHGDRYLRTVDPEDLPHLYRCATLLDAGIRVGGSTDAPFGPEDPWVAIRAAVDRTTRDGAVLGAGEAVPARTALDSFLGDPRTPGGPPRTVGVGDPADLCLLDVPLGVALAEAHTDRVVATWIGGELVHFRI